MPRPAYAWQRLMWAAVVVEADPVSDDSARMLDALEAMAVNTLLLEGVVALPRPEA